MLRILLATVACFLIIQSGFVRSSFAAGNGEFYSDGKLDHLDWSISFNDSNLTVLGRKFSDVLRRNRAVEELIQALNVEFTRQYEETPLIARPALTRPTFHIYANGVFIRLPDSGESFGLTSPFYGWQDMTNEEFVQGVVFFLKNRDVYSTTEKAEAYLAKVEARLHAALDLVEDSDREMVEELIRRLPKTLAPPVTETTTRRRSLFWKQTEVREITPARMVIAGGPLDAVEKLMHIERDLNRLVGVIGIDPDAAEREIRLFTDYGELVFEAANAESEQFVRRLDNQVGSFHFYELYEKTHLQGGKLKLSIDVQSLGIGKEGELKMYTVSGQIDAVFGDRVESVPFSARFNSRASALKIVDSGEWIPSLGRAIDSAVGSDVGATAIVAGLHTVIAPLGDVLPVEEGDGCEKILIQAAG